MWRQKKEREEFFFSFPLSSKILEKWEKREARDRARVFDLDLEVERRGKSSSFRARKDRWRKSLTISRAECIRDPFSSAKGEGKRRRERRRNAGLLFPLNLDPLPPPPGSWKKTRRLSFGPRFSERFLVFYMLSLIAFLARAAKAPRATRPTGREKNHGGGGVGDSGKKIGPLFFVPLVLITFRKRKVACSELQIANRLSPVARLRTLLPCLASRRGKSPPWRLALAQRADKSPG